MIDPTLLAIFIPTFFLISLTPGMCMTLAMTLGMTLGIRKTFWMMLGELLGVAIVAISSVIGVSTIMLKQPLLFSLFKLIGATYLLIVGINMWRSKGNLAIKHDLNSQPSPSKTTLFNQGLLTAIGNPKGWAFLVSLLPPFINPEYQFAIQLTILVSVILCSEFICMMIYATGGKTLGKLLTQGANVKRLNKISGSMLIIVAAWMAFA